MLYSRISFVLTSNAFQHLNFDAEYEEEEYDEEASEEDGDYEYEYGENIEEEDVEEVALSDAVPDGT